MKKVALGDVGVEVSALCLGAMYLGTRNDDKSSFELLDQYLGAGGSFIDTANIYAHWVPGFQGGESETLLGHWMRARRNRRDIFLATKVGFDYHEVDKGLSAAQIQAECEKSLQRLGVETIDLYYAHVDDRATPLEETLEAFSRLVAAGKVRFVGASNYLAWRLEAARNLSEAQGWPTYQCVQQRHTYLRPRPGAGFDPQIAVNEDLLDYCRVSPGDPVGLFGAAERRFYPPRPPGPKRVSWPGNGRAPGCPAGSRGGNGRDSQSGGPGLDAGRGSASGSLDRRQYIGAVSGEYRGFGSSARWRPDGSSDRGFSCERVVL